MLVPNIHWIIVEDSIEPTRLLKRFVQRLKFLFGFKAITHLNQETPEAFRLKPGDPSWAKPKGIWQRNKALQWLRENQESLDSDGILYFADDDNIYDLELFHEMRDTKKISVWPVAFAGGLLVEKPLVDLSTGRVTSFNSMWKRQRPFPFDMAGFAMRLRMVVDKSQALFSEKQPIGYVESHFIGQFVSHWSDLEPRANNCTKILVWHTRMQRPALHEERKLAMPSNYGMA